MAGAQRRRGEGKESRGPQHVQGAYHVYVLDVIGGTDNEVYVGQSAKTPEERRDEHINGPRRGKVFKRPGRSVGALRPDLLPTLSPLRSRVASTAAEAYVAAVLRTEGFTVHGAP